MIFLSSHTRFRARIEDYS